MAEDIIELLLSDSLLQSTVNASPLNEEILLSDPSLDSTVGSKSKFEVRHDFYELERVIKEIESIAQGVNERHKEAGDDSNDDLMQMISRLCNDKWSRREIVTIVGRGGIGKTTLARNAFNHPTVVEHFQIRAWATVTQDFSLRGVLSGLLRSMNMSNANDLLKSDHELSTIIERILRYKRFLIVLDDVWSRTVWDTLNFIFPSKTHGSRIILSTRYSSVANIVSYRRYIDVTTGEAKEERYGTYIHEIKLMNLDQSWKLLRQKIFRGNPCPPKLEYMGKMIAKSCGGLPLTIEVVSGILAADQTPAAWEDIAENLKTSIDFEDHDKHISQILYMSYTHLPHHLRPLLLYLGFFWKDHEISVSKLIKLWVAEGFLNEGGSHKSFEEMCEEYLEDLVRRSLVLVGKRKSNGRIKSCSIHDLMREMCIKQAEVDNFFHATPQAIKYERRVSILDSDLKRASGSTVRTIISLEGNQQCLQQRLRYFMLLRILDLSNAHKLLWEHDFPNQVFELFHLRYLAFGYPFNISEAISNLENLQTLVVYPRKHQRNVVKLPIDIWRMPQLRHLVVASCELPCQEEAMFPLENLQTLSKAVDLICSKETLKMMPNLKKLCIIFTPRRDPGEDYDQLHNLIYLKELEVLKIKVSYSVKKLPRIRPPPFLPILKKLSLKGLKLPWEEMKIVASLPNLQVLKLRNDACIGSTWETSEGGFSQLTFLMIVRSDLEHWITKSSHFPKLKCLVLRHIWRMSGIPHEIGEIQALESIEVNSLNKAVLQSVRRIQEDRQSLGNDPLQIHVV